MKRRKRNRSPLLLDRIRRRVDRPGRRPDFRFDTDSRTICITHAGDFVTAASVDDQGVRDAIDADPAAMLAGVRPEQRPHLVAWAGRESRAGRIPDAEGGGRGA